MNRGEADPPSPAELPEQVSIPWSQVAARLGRPPILTHSSIVIHNWKRIVGLLH
jgi:indoleamine 2,3-dioxygenase